MTVIILLLLITLWSQVFSNVNDSACPNKFNTTNMNGKLVTYVTNNCSNSNCCKTNCQNHHTIEVNQIEDKFQNYDRNSMIMYPIYFIMLITPLLALIYFIRSCYRTTDCNLSPERRINSDINEFCMADNERINRGNSSFIIPLHHYLREDDDFDSVTLYSLEDLPPPPYDEVMASLSPKRHIHYGDLWP